MINDDIVVGAIKVGDTHTVSRLLDLPTLVKKKSHFLLGPRQTGKTFLIRQTLPDVRVYDLLDTSTYLALSQNPGRIAEELAPQERMVVIDEIQRLPELLNEVHRIIENSGVRFLLTGSSTRKLRRGGVTSWGAGRVRSTCTLSHTASLASVWNSGARSSVA